MLKITRNALLALLPFTFTVSAFATPNSTIPEPVLKSLASHKIEPSALSLAAIPLTGNRSPLYINADNTVSPASTMKLFTTYAALDLLGPNYQWKTAFYTDGTIKGEVLNGNLYLKGGGDPKLNMERLWLLLRDLRNNGVKTINGNLVLDGHYFHMPQNHTTFNDDGKEPYRPYLVEPNSLLINFKVLRVISRAEGNKSYITLEPPIKAIAVTDNINVTPATTVGKCPAIPDIRYDPVPQSDGTINLVVSGKLTNNCNTQTYLSVLDHDHYAIGIVRAIWKELGGNIVGSNQLGVTPANAKLLAITYSPDLVDVTRDVNKFSNNTMAKQVFLSIGARYRKATDTDDAAAAFRTINEWLSRKGVNSSQLRIENGSGLSRDEQTTAREMAGLLKLAWNNNYSAEFISSLPIIGVDGTMRKRLKNTPLKGRGHIKTGTLKNVRAVGGYVRDVDGNVWAVAVILNHPRPWGASEILDKALLYIYNPK